MNDTLHKCGQCGAEFPNEESYVAHACSGPGEAETVGKYLFIRRVPGQDDVREYIALERWTWKAKYIDGTELSQFDDRDKSFHQIAEIDQSRLLEFRMLNTEAPWQNMVLKFDSGSMRLVHSVLNAVLNNGDLRLRIYVFGFIKTLTNEKSVHYILPNNELVISDRDDLVFEL